MKRILLIATILTAGLAMRAADYGYLIVEQQDSSSIGLPVGGLTLVFADGKLTAQTQGQTVTLQQALLSKMYFAEEDLSGIAETSNALQTTIRVSDRLVQVQAPVGSRVLIASVGGMLIDRYTAGAEPINTPLRPGIYIVKVNNKSTKIHVR